MEFYYLHFDGSNAHEICQHRVRTVDPEGPVFPFKN
jgi:hypothetical protein